jgi:hypothetical protein
MYSGCSSALQRYIKVRHILGVSVQTFTELDGRPDFFYFLLFGVAHLMRICDGPDKGTASNFVQISGKKSAMKSPHFVTIEVIDSEPQAVLTTLTEHDFQDVFTIGRRPRNGAYARKETT